VRGRAARGPGLGPLQPPETSMNFLIFHSWLSTGRVSCSGRNYAALSELCDGANMYVVWGAGEGVVDVMQLRYCL
jgi:hypothetical protein